MQRLYKQMGHERSNLEDQLLVMDAQDGSRQAMEQLVIRWQKRLWQYAFRLTGDSHAAWDVTQSVWYDIIRRLGKLHDPAGFGSWAYKITTCKAFDWIKKKPDARQIPVESLDTFAAKSKPQTGID
jgi:RNA polymerase sigma-70 factor, ECF subfamily